MPQTDSQHDEQAAKNLDEILAGLGRRKNASRWGIGTAAGYLRSLESCLIGGSCPQKAFALASPEQWGAVLKEAENRLTYCAEDMRIGDVKAPNKSSAAKSIMDFACRITSNKQDRDGDILEPGGAEPDERMALLWQHIPIEPIGKLVSITKQTEKFVDGVFSIADTELGNDAAKLVEFGALRISHGFRPLKYEPMFTEKTVGRKTEEEFSGWHVLKYEIMETSLVSVPSNTDAVITNFSRNKFHHPAVKAWAKGFWRERKRFVKPGWTKTVTTINAGDVRLTVESTKGTDMEAESQGSSAGTDASKEATPTNCACSTKGKQGSQPVTKKPASEAKPIGQKLYIPTVEGSWEWVREKLSATLKTFLVGKGKCGPYDHAYIDSMFADHALVCVNESYSDTDYYNVPWVMSGTEPVWTGEPVYVEVTATIIAGTDDDDTQRIEDQNTYGEMLVEEATHAMAKQLGISPRKAAEIRLALKAGKVLANKHADALGSACELMKEAMERDDMTKGCKALVKEAHGHVQGVLDAAAPKVDDESTEDETEPDGDEVTEEKAVRSLVERAVDATDLDAIERLRKHLKQISGVLTIRQDQLEDQEFKKLLAEI